MIILGIDPGTARMGWGAIKVKKGKLVKSIVARKQDPAKDGKKNGDLKLIAYGCVVTSKEDEVGKRLGVLRDELKKLITEHTPDLMVVERLFFGINAKTAISVGQATGVIMLTAAEHGVPVLEYTGLQVKLVVAGHGRADKKIVQQKIRQMLGVNKRTLSFSAKDHAWDDASDALAIAICHVLR